MCEYNGVDARIIGMSMIILGLYLQIIYQPLKGDCLSKLTNISKGKVEAEYKLKMPYRK